MTEVLTSTDELLAARPDDVYLRGEITPGRSDLPAWANGAAICFQAARPTGWRRLVALGAPAAVADLVLAALADLPTRPDGFTVERAAYPLLAARLGGVGETDDWDFQWTSAPPPELPAERQVRWLPDTAADAAGIRELLARSSPRHDVTPGESHVRRWAGARGPGGELVACAADTRRAAAVAHLASVATAPEARGRGLGGAVTAWITRQVLAEGDPVCTLSLYADNEPAKRLYRRLGYQEEHHFTSGPFTGDRREEADQPVG